MGRTLRAGGDGSWAQHLSGVQGPCSRLHTAGALGSCPAEGPRQRGGRRQRLLCQPCGARPRGGQLGRGECYKRELRTPAGQWGGHPVSGQDLFLMSNGWKITLDPFLKGGEGTDQFTEGRGVPGPGNASTVLFSNRIKAKTSFEPLGAADGCHASPRTWLLAGLGSGP